MATIRLNNNDLRVMIREAVERLCEGQWYEAEPLCRLPYFVSVNFSDHAIEREYEREISQDRVIENLQKVVKELISDYQEKIIGPDDYFKVIDRDSCIVAVCGINPSYNKKRIKQVVVVTCYVWDGRVNIENGNFYYVNEPSRDFIDAQDWNAENQDKVMSYTEWKRYGDTRAIKQQQRKADKEYYWRNHPHETPPEKRMNRLNAAFDSYERKKKHDIHDALPDGDLKTIQDYFRDMDSRHINLEPLYEFVRKAAKQAVREAFRKSTSKNSSTTKKAGKNGFYA